MRLKILYFYSLVFRQQTSLKKLLKHPNFCDTVWKSLVSFIFSPKGTGLCFNHVGKEPEKSQIWWNMFKFRYITVKLNLCCVCVCEGWVGSTSQHQPIKITPKIDFFLLPSIESEKCWSGQGLSRSAMMVRDAIGTKDAWKNILV